MAFSDRQSHSHASARCPGAVPVIGTKTTPWTGARASRCWTRSFGVQTAIDAAATSGEEGLRSTLIKSMTVPAGDDAVLLPAGHYTVSLKLCRPPRGGQCVVARQPIAPHL
jgi:hypothetical protein